LPRARGSPSIVGKTNSCSPGDFSRGGRNVVVSGWAFGHLPPPTVPAGPGSGPDDGGNARQPQWARPGRRAVFTTWLTFTGDAGGRKLEEVITAPGLACNDVAPYDPGSRGDFFLERLARWFLELLGGGRLEARGGGAAGEGRGRDRGGQAFSFETIHSGGGRPCRIVASLLPKPPSPCRTKEARLGHGAPAPSNHEPAGGTSRA